MKENLESMPNLEAKKQEEAEELFKQLLDEARQRLKKVEKEDEQNPDLKHERMDMEYDLDWQFEQAWKHTFPEVNIFESREEADEIKNKQISLLKKKLPALYQIAAEKYRQFIQEDRWESAELWEMSIEGQFFHLIEDMKENFKKKLMGFEQQEV